MLKPTFFKPIFAAFLACVLAWSIAPSHAADNATTDDTARFLAGMPVSADSPLIPLTKSAVWQQHAKYFDSIFAKQEAGHLARVRAFARAQLGAAHHPTLLYFFSGPDALHAVALYPEATTYVLAGLEPVGNVPQLTTLRPGSVHAALRNLETSTGVLLALSFFRTHDMRLQLNSGQVYGTLPIIYAFLARSGKTVQEATLVNLDSSGELKLPGEPGVKPTAKGVKVVFSEGNGPKRTLYYFSTNLADDGVKSSGFLTFCEKLGPADAFIKSASYLMHGSGFTRVRSFLVANTQSVLQDDSGIPLRYFDRNQWTLQPFGRYLGPIAIFPRTYQRDMAELYRKGSPVPLDFGIGYRWRHGESNLLLATRTATAKTN